MPANTVKPSGDDYVEYLSCYYKIGSRERLLRWNGFEWVKCNPKYPTRIIKRLEELEQEIH